MSANKCKNCGSTDIETDPSRGDAVCTQCGVVLEDQIIVNENEFAEGPHGNITLVGQFVSSESSGGVSTRFGAGYHISSKESRENTIKNARKGITHLCNQLQLKQHYIDQAVTYYKLALEKNLTRGRKQSHNHAACVYITCRTASTEHMLIDISDVLQICVHELGRTYLKFTQALCIKPPSIDPCLYVMRFANQLQFGDKTHEVSMTALRVVQRMKRDSIHSGRRPSGLCGAALLIAARLHEFNRSTADIIKIVKVHESTLRKRLIEFGETPSSALTLEEFMTVDLEEEQDPPAFKAAKKKDRERIAKMQNVDQELLELQNEIEKHLDLPKYAKKKSKDDSVEFIRDSTLTVLQSCVRDSEGNSVDEVISKAVIDDFSIGLGPNLKTMGLINSNKPSNKDKEDLDFENENGDIKISDIDDDELDGYIMSEKEAQNKSSLWYKVNEKYLEEQKEKEEKRLKDIEEGKPEKKRKKVKKTTKNQQPANSAGEAIEKMLQEKKISSKINYDVLKSLNIGTNNFSSQKNPETATETIDNESKSENISNPFTKVPAITKSPVVNTTFSRTPNLTVKRKLDDEPSDQVKKPMSEENPSEVDASDDLVDDEYDDYIADEVEPEPEITVRDMLNVRNAVGEGYGYGEYDDYDDY